MIDTSCARRYLALEASGLLARLYQVRPFSLTETMVPAAAPLPGVLPIIDEHLRRIKLHVRDSIERFIDWLSSDAISGVPAEAVQHRYAMLRMKYDWMMSQVDHFSDAITQRSELMNGVWLAGLDVLAQDAMKVPGFLYPIPPAMCYLDRGIGAAIRRLHTPLPGGSRNPVAFIRIPRERMVGSGIAASLVHEAGHQVSALLGLVDSIRPTLRGMQKKGGPELPAWILWERWISEILPDLWAVGKIGIGATMGLMTVVSLPSPLIFRFNPLDPHPMPWIRVVLSAALGNGLYPHPQWRRMQSLWHNVYPPTGATKKVRHVIDLLSETMPTFVDLILQHRPRILGGASIADISAAPDRTPEALSRKPKTRMEIEKMILNSPTRFLAVIGQNKANGNLSAGRESSLISASLAVWAKKGTACPIRLHHHNKAGAING